MKQMDVRSRIQLNNILFATDFSVSAEAAAPYAASLAQHYGAQLYAIHVRLPAVSPLAPPESWESLEEGAKIMANEERQKLLATFHGMDPEILLPEGDFWSKVSSTVDSKNIDLIVMGTRGRSGIRKFLLGSAAEEVFRDSVCPVLTVGPYSHARQLDGATFARIVFATDLNAQSNAAVAYALSLAQEYQSHLLLLHVIPAPKVGEFVSPHNLKRLTERALRALIPSDTELWCSPEYLVESGNPAEKILDVAAAEKADLIVLGLHRPKGLPGAATHLPLATAHKVVAQANCPVLTVRTEE